MPVWDAFVDAHHASDHAELESVRDVKLVHVPCDANVRCILLKFGVLH